MSVLPVPELCNQEPSRGHGECDTSSTSGLVQLLLMLSNVGSGLHMSSRLIDSCITGTDGGFKGATIMSIVQLDECLRRSRMAHCLEMRSNDDDNFYDNVCRPTLAATR
jgi:hypothetical protein